MVDGGRECGAPSPAWGWGWGAGGARGFGFYFFLVVPTVCASAHLESGPITTGDRD